MESQIHSFTVPTPANTKASNDILTAVRANAMTKSTPLGPSFKSFRKCPPRITRIAFRFVLSSRLRITRAPSDSGQSPEESDEDVLESLRIVAFLCSIAARLKVHTSLNTFAIVATPAERSGRAASLARKRATSTESASDATRRNAAPSFAPISLPTTSCERFAINS